MKAPAEPRLDIGRVIGRSFAIIQQRWLALGAFVLGDFAIRWVAGAYLQPSYQPGRHDLRLAVAVALFFAADCVIWLRDTAFTATALQAAPSPFAASMASAASAALRTFPTLLPFFVLTQLPNIVVTLWYRWAGDGFLTSAATVAAVSATIGYGQLALAVVVTAGWGVVVAVAIVEGGNLRDSLARAWQLLAGSRWRLVAIFVMVTVADLIVRLLAGAVVEPTVEAARRLPGNLSTYVVAEVAVLRVLTSIVTAVWRVMIGAAYLELRRLREGVVDADIAAVFA